MRNWINSKIFQTIIPFVGSLIFRLFAMTMEVRVLHMEYEYSLKEQGKNCIYASWHDRLLFLTYFYRKKNMYGMVSQSRDGDLISGFIRWFGNSSIRGSTSKGGLKALIQLAGCLEKGFDVGITPDGPRGPRHVVQNGVIVLAKRSRAPILPITYSASYKKVFKSWDRFILPLPFSRIVVNYGEPLFVDSNAGEEEVVALGKQLENTLNTITDEADRALLENHHD